MSQNLLMASCDRFLIHSLGEFVLVMRKHFPWVMIEIVDAHRDDGSLIRLYTTALWESKPVNDDEDARLDQNFYQVVQDYLAPDQTATFQQAAMLRGQLTFIVTMVGKEFIYVADDSLFRAAMAAFSTGSFGKVRDIELPPPEKKWWNLEYHQDDPMVISSARVEAVNAIEAREIVRQNYPGQNVSFMSVIPDDKYHRIAEIRR